MTATWIDIGVNLADPSFRPDLDDVLARADAAGVSTMIITGTSLERSRVAADMTATRPGQLFSTAGVHPHDARSCSDETLTALRELAASPAVVAIGECGLDFNRNYSPPDVQRTWFERQLQLAGDLAMPVFVHERDAAGDMITLLARYRDAVPRIVVHCFTGDGATLRAYLDLDVHIGITGWICDERRGLGLRELVGLIPAGRLMLETDAPYLLPRTLRPRPSSRRNEPAYLVAVAECVAECRGESLEELAEHTTATARAFFGLP